MMEFILIFGMDVCFHKSCHPSWSKGCFFRIQRKSSVYLVKIHTAFFIILQGEMACTIRQSNPVKGAGAHVFFAC